MKTIATLATTAALALGGLAFAAAPASADNHCTPGEDSCVIDTPVEPCAPGETYSTGGVCVLPGGQEIAATDWSKVVAAAERKARESDEVARAAQEAAVVSANAQRIAEQAADTYRLQTIELTAQVAKMDRTIDRKTATIRRLRAKIRDLRQN